MPMIIVIMKFTFGLHIRLYPYKIDEQGIHSLLE